MSASPSAPNSHPSPPDEGFAHRFDQAIDLAPIGERRFRAQTDRSYWNQAGPYGGITAAVVMQALMRQSDLIGDPLALTVNYAGALAEGEYEVIVDLRRSNRTTQHWSVEIHQNEGGSPSVAITATAVFAIRRDVWSRPEVVAPAVPPAEQVPTLARRTDRSWPLMYEMRFVQGLPLQGDRDDSRSVYWIRDEPPRPIDYPALVAICDSAFPRAFVIRNEVTPTATVSMNIYFHGSAQALARDGNGHLLIDTAGNVYDSGFSDQQAWVWTDTGRLLATTQQVVWYKR